MVDYKGVLALAPMVRVSELPMRTLALHYGADLVWGPEIVDKKLIKTTRQWNERLQTVDFVHSADGRLVFRTRPDLERERLVFQLGTADPDLAVQAARLVAPDVAQIDLNSGCPKHFSIHSGMGAALLQTPDLLVKILTELVEKVGRPLGVAISVKIRILDSAQKTYDLVSQLVATGISCLTVHCRTTPMRSREPAVYDYLPGIVDRCHRANVPCLVNGDVGGRDDCRRIMEQYGVDGAMIGRAAEANVSCFRDGGPLTPWSKLCSEFIAQCEADEYPLGYAKYCLTKIIPGKDPRYAAVAQSKSIDMLKAALHPPPASPLPKKQRVDTNVCVSR